MTTAEGPLEVEMTPVKGGHTYLTIFDEKDADSCGVLHLLAKWTNSENTDHVVLYSHIHHDPSASTGWLRKLGRRLTFQEPPRSRVERHATTEKFLHEVQAAMRQDQYTKVDVAVDMCEFNATQAFQHQLAQSKPDIILINEREDKDSIWGLLVKSEVDAALRSVQKGAVAVVRNISNGLPEDVSERWNYLLCVDPQWSAEAQAALDLLCSVAKPNDAVCVFLTVQLPDVATAMYTTDDVWAQHIKKATNNAKKVGNEVKQAYLARVKSASAESVSVVVRDQTFCQAALSLLEHYEFHVVILGMKPSSQSGMLQRASTAVLGSNAEYLVRHSVVPVVVSAFV